MPVRLGHIVIRRARLAGAGRFWTQARGWKILSAREQEIVIGADEDAPVGICFMPVTDSTCTGFLPTAFMSGQDDFAQVTRPIGSASLSTA